MTDSSFLDWFRAAAPYFTAHRGKTVVVYVDGGVLSGDGFHEFVHDLALLHSLGVRLVLVPSVRSQIDARLADAGSPAAFVDDVRITSAEAMTALRDAAAAAIVELQARLSMGLANSPMHGARIRVSSGNFITARPYGVRDGVDYGFTGEVRRVDGDAIHGHLDAQAVVVVPPIGFSPTGEVFNLLATDLASQVAIALAAYKLILIAPSATVLENTVRVSDLTVVQAAERFDALSRETDPAAWHRFKAALDACRGGVRRVHLLDAQERGAIARELYTRDGIGTMVNADGYHTVRRARVDDIASLLELIEPLERDGQLVRRSRLDIERTIDQYYVDEHDGAVIACAAAHPFREAHAMELACLAVHPDYRGDGRGDLLLSKVEGEATRSGMHSLFVLTTFATHWFKERGFDDAEVDDLPVERRALYNYQRGSKVLIKPLVAQR